MKTSRQYDAFVDKFKPRHTSDDTHTPPNVYEAVLAWCERRYGIDRAKVLRPFYPGGDYANAEYPEGCVVIDNPPFSILSQIVRFYLGRDIPFFLFAPALTCFGHTRHPGCAAIFANGAIRYDNGAEVRTAFLTSLEGPDVLAVSAPDLAVAIERAASSYRKAFQRPRRRLVFPAAMLTCAGMNLLAARKTPHTVRRSEAVFVRKLDNCGGIYGGGFLLSERAAAERAAAERAAAERAAAERAAAERAAAGRAAANKVELSAREREIVKNIGKENA